MQEYADVFDNKTLGCLPVQHTINLKEDAKPVIHAPRKIPVAIRIKVKEELDHMQHLGVIEPVEEPTDWVSSMVTITKRNKTRICLDPRDLNNSIKREHYPMPTIEEIVSRLPQATVFSTLDATCGYWQIPVDEKSSKLLTFNTPYGRFRRLPFGISSASEVFQRTMNQLFGDIEGCEIIVDDILIWGKDEVEHDERLLKVLERARNIGLRLKEEKCKLKVPKLKYIGHTLTADGLKPDPEKIEAVKKMPAPQKPLYQSPLRLQSMLLKLQRYDLKVTYKKGTQLHIADTLSRACLNNTDQETEFEDLTVHATIPFSAEKSEQLKAATLADPTLTALRKIILEGWPKEKRAVDPSIKHYWDFSETLSIYDDIIFKGEKVVIPASMINTILNSVHSGHRGAEACKRRAREAVYWPTMTKDIQDHVEKCKPCNEAKPQHQKEPLLLQSPPTRPWQHIATDLFELDKQIYLLTADAYSGWFEIDHLQDIKATTIIKKIKRCTSAVMESQTS
jgi:hypothetical protein